MDAVARGVPGRRTDPSSAGVADLTWRCVASVAAAEMSRRPRTARSRLSRIPRVEGRGRLRGTASEPPAILLVNLPVSPRPIESKPHTGQGAGARDADPHFCGWRGARR